MTAVLRSLDLARLMTSSNRILKGDFGNNILCRNPVSREAQEMAEEEAKVSQQSCVEAKLESEARCAKPDAGRLHRGKPA